MMVEVDFHDVNIILMGIRAEIRGDYKESYSRPVTSEITAKAVERLKELRERLDYWEGVHTLIKGEGKN